MRVRSAITAGASAWEWYAVTTRRVPTISHVWQTHRITPWRHLLYWLTGWLASHLWKERYGDPRGPWWRHVAYYLTGWAVARAWREPA